MAEKAKIIKKVSRKKSAKKEIEIPILVVSSKKKENILAEREIFISNTGDTGVFPTIRKDENDLPVFENVSPRGEEISEPGREEKNAELMREAKQADKSRLEVSEETPNKISARRASTWSPAKKKVVMWVSVTAFTAVIFLVWISVLGKNLSFDLGSNSYTYFKETVDNPELGQSLENFKEGWADLGNAIKEEPAAESADDTIDKLQEKILVEEMKNKLENQ